jgi:hypothetical protein
MNGRYDRNIRFFGKEGQDSLGKTSVTIVGVGGVGGHVAQQLALLGPASIALVDAEELEDTNRNRYVTAAAADPVPGTPKVDIGERLIKAINPAIRVITVQDSVVSDRAFEAIIGSDYVFGCLDSEGARLVLTELCAAYKRPYLDTATDIETSDKLRYGGRVCVAMLGAACLVCLGQLDANEANAELGGPEARKLRAAIYGVNPDQLDRSGPSVVSINGVVASLAVTEFMLSVTGVRQPYSLVTYRGDSASVRASRDEPQPDCYYCKAVWGKGVEADVQRYIRAGIGAFLR